MTILEGKASENSPSLSHRRISVSPEMENPAGGGCLLGWRDEGRSERQIDP